MNYTGSLTHPGFDLEAALYPPSLNVLLTTDTVGGVWTFVLELACELENHGHQVSLVTLGKSINQSQRQDLRRLRNVEVFETPFKLEWMQDPWYDVYRTREFLSELEWKIEPDIVHLNTLIAPREATYCPSVMTLHSCVRSWWRAVKGSEAPVSEWGRYREEVERSLRTIDALVAVSGSFAKDFAREYHFNKPIQSIYNGRDPDNYNFLKSIPKKELVFSSGRLWDEGKNLKILAQVAPALKWPVWVAGESVGPRSEFQLSNHSNLRVLGELSPLDMKECVRAAALYVCPSLYEPFGLSVLEAALAGSALLLSDIESLREIWGPSAFYFDATDPSHLQKQLEVLIEDRLLREEFSSRARARAQELFTAQRMTGQYLSLYQKLIDKRDAGTKSAKKSGNRELSL
jgi:glycogen synthase